MVNEYNKVIRWLIFHLIFYEKILREHIPNIRNSIPSFCLIRLREYSFLFIGYSHRIPVGVSVSAIRCSKNDSENSVVIVGVVINKSIVDSVSKVGIV